MAGSSTLLDAFSALADRTRCRMVRLLEQHELTVSELCAVVQLPQSTVSRHLKTLADAGLVTSRRDGTSRYYTVSFAGADDVHARVWDLARTELEGPGSEQDARRLTRILARRRETSEQFFASSAGQWDRLRADLFGEDMPWRALLGLLPADWCVADLGCGTGAVVAALAPNVRRVIGVDASEEMLAAARSRTAGIDNVDLRSGALEALPVDEGTVDAAVLVLVLHHLAAPVAALAEAKRILRPAGRLLIVDMTAHDHEEYRAQMGHVWLGFSEDQIRRFCEQAGFTAGQVIALPASTTARGPGLFAVTATAPGPLPTRAIETLEPAGAGARG